MYPANTHYCPRCRHAIDEDLSRVDQYSCPKCLSLFRVLFDTETDRAALIDISRRGGHHPLFLPKGSVRALVSLALAVSFWGLTFTGRDVPGYLMGLLLTVVGYYFGYRADVDRSGLTVHDSAPETQRPLNLPAGVIRLVLIAGFAASAAVLLERGELSKLPYVEFFVILFGLLLGTVFGKLLARVRHTGAYGLVNHVKAIVVLALAGFLAWAMLAEPSQETIPQQEIVFIVLCSLISFYFGSRT